MQRIGTLTPLKGHSQITLDNFNLQTLQISNTQKKLQKFVYMKNIRQKKSVYQILKDIEIIAYKSQKFREISAINFGLIFENTSTHRTVCRASERKRDKTIRAPFLSQRNAEISAMPSRESGLTHEKRNNVPPMYKVQFKLFEEFRQS